MKIIVGIDEVGRGPLAGPVTVCVVSCSVEVYKKLKTNKSLPKAGKDSKKLTPEDRKKYSEILKNYSELNHAVVHVSNKIIDSRGISFAIKRAIFLGLRKLKLNPKNCEVLLDGGLRAGKEFTKQKTIIKGDEKEKIIAWASILAKVRRDALMVKLGKSYPKYGFSSHKGYGTKIHKDAIRKYGVSIVHRRTFIHS